MYAVAEDFSLSGTTRILFRLQARGGGGVEGSQEDITKEALVSLRDLISCSALSRLIGPVNSTSPSECSLMCTESMPLEELVPTVKYKK